MNVKTGHIIPTLDMQPSHRVTLQNNSLLLLKYRGRKVSYHVNLFGHMFDDITGNMKILTGPTGIGNGL